MVIGNDQLGQGVSEESELWNSSHLLGPGVSPFEIKCHLRIRMLRIARLYMKSAQPSPKAYSVRLCEKHGDDEPTGMSGFIPPARNQACFLLDEAAIDMLAEIR